MLQADILVAEVTDVEGQVHQLGVPALVHIDSYGRRQAVYVTSEAWPLGPAGLIAALRTIQDIRADFRTYWPDRLHEVDWSILLRKMPTYQ